MVERRGIGATLAAALIFSVILLSNLALVSAAQDRARLYAAADAEESVRAISSALSDSGGADLLYSVQNYLGGGALGCQGAEARLKDQIARVSEVQTEAGVTVLVTAALVHSGSSADNMSAIAPFGGSVPGDVDVALRVVAAAEVQPGVGFRKVETHLAHLPARFEKEASDCNSAVSAISGSAGEGVPQNCTSGAISPLMAAAAKSPASVARGDGFTFSYTFSADASGGCAVRFQVFLTQPGVPGPGGDFAVTMAAEGSATFGPPSPSQQA